MKKRLLLPCLTGKFGSWRYYNVVMKIKDIIDPTSGIKSVPESRKIYTSDNLNEIMQRLENEKRIDPIKTYILKQTDRYFNSLTVAVTGGDPKWYPVSINKDDKFSEKERDYLNLKYGILELTGNEDLFILDGQHRLLGLRKAYEVNDSIGEEEVSIMMVIHEDSAEGLKKIRRVFVALNRNAKPVSEGENIILEEDDASAIIARQLVEKYPLFKKHKSIALNKNLNLKTGKADIDKFTTLLALYNINETLIDNDSLYEVKISGKYVRIRPTDKQISEAYKESEEFWNAFFNVFPSAKKFIQKPNENLNLKDDSGGVFYLRPIGQEIIAQLYAYLRDAGSLSIFQKLTQVEPFLDSSFWNYVLHNPYKPGRIVMNKANALTYLMYHLGLKPSEVSMNKLRTDYKERSGDLNLPLPKPRYKK